MKNSSKKASEDIIDFLFRQTLGIVVSLLIFTGMIGGGTYLLFTRQNDINTLNDAKISYEQEKQRLRNENDLLNLAINGWFTQPQNKEYLNFVVSIIKEDVESGSLDEAFITEAVLWCDNSISKLSTEKGTLKGYLTTDVYITKYQNSVLNLYENQIEINKAIRSLLTDWNSLQNSERQSQVSVLNEKMIEQESLLQTSLAEVKQIQS